MKIKTVVCFVVLLLLFSSCRSGLQKNAADSGTVTASAASSATSAQLSEDTSGAPSNSGVPPSPSPASPAAGDTGASPPAPSPSEQPNGAQSSVSAAPGMAASKEETNATLDDIIKELNDLDKLYSQMDNLSESDLN